MRRDVIRIALLLAFIPSIFMLWVSMHNLKKIYQKNFTDKVKQSEKLYPAGNYVFNVNNRNTRKKCEICPKLTIKIPERRH